MRQTMLRAALILTLAGVSLLATGCHVEENDHGDGKNVRIATPFGNMHVKTGSDEVLAAIGLPGYPGATMVKNNGHNNSGSADVDMSFGSFQLRVKAASFHSDDSPAKVLAFYQKALARYGTVIQCRGGHAVGSPTATDEGLDCENGGKHVDLDGDTKTELKAGSRKHQHIVAVSSDGNGAKFGLVALDLPLDVHIGGSDSDDEGKAKQ